MIVDLFLCALCMQATLWQVETVVTFNVAYRASVVLGTVLLQTSPERGLSGGRMEVFLRAMKEVGFCDFYIFSHQDLPIYYLYVS
jgi:hypothetical protein